MPTVGLVKDIEVKFHSAVALVRSLPQKGSFQPSYNDASKVYGYYKQANFGPCNHSKPAFWDVVGRAKWDAWNALGNMPKDEAMENYVNEIKKLFQKLTNMEEFKEAQADFSHVIIPFCESNDIELPDALAKYKIVEKKKQEKKKLKNTLKSLNGIENGHVVPSKERSSDFGNNGFGGDSVEPVPNVSVDAIPTEMNGSLEQDIGSVCDNEGHVTSDQPVDGEGKNLQSEAVFTQISSYIDAESSDDDVYCDSFNPDEISGQTQYNTATANRSQFQDSTRSEMINSADETSMLIAADANEMEDGDGIVLKNSTPVVKIRPCNKEKLNNDSSDSSKDAHTDLSTLSSISGELNGRNDASISSQKAGKGRLEVELEHEFESKPSKHIKKPRNKDVERNRRERKQHEFLGKRDMVVCARGNSQTDLAGSAEGNREKEESEGVEQRGTDSSRRRARHSSRNPRRTNANTSSDSDQSTGSSTGSGDTIGEQIVKALGRLERDMRLVLRRLDSIENRISDVSHAVNRRAWWAAYLPSRRYLFLLLWPIFIHIIFAFWRRRRKK